MPGQNQLLIRNHGAVVCDEMMVRTLTRAIYLEKNAEWQHKAADVGELTANPDDELDRIYDGNWKESLIDKFWRFYQWKARKEGHLPEAW